VARQLELEHEILADREDPEAYRVYGDWLQGEGDPRGELIALHLKIERDEKDDNAMQLARSLLEREPELMPQLNPWSARFHWDRGFISTADLDDPTEEELAMVLLHPSCAVLSKLVVHVEGAIAANVVRRIADAVSPIEQLEIDHAVIPLKLGTVPPIDDTFWDRVPHLTSLKLSNPGLFATFRHDRLGDLQIEGDAPARRAVEPWQLPALTRLRWSNPGRHVDQLWKSALPALRELELCYRMGCLFEQAEASPFVAVVRRLETLALPHTALLPQTAIHGQEGAAVAMLHARAEQLEHLRSLVVFSPRGLPDQSIKARLPNLDWGPGR